MIIILYKTVFIQPLWGNEVQKHFNQILISHFCVNTFLETYHVVQQICIICILPTNKSVRLTGTFKLLLSSYHMWFTRCIWRSKPYNSFKCKHILKLFLFCTHHSDSVPASTARKNLPNCLQLTCKELKFYSSQAFDVQWLCIMHSHCTSKLATTKDQSNTHEVAAYQLQAVEQVFLAV
jgi:hypothetical protein